MQLNALDVLNHLHDQGVTHLHHANTVGTACTFLRHGGLISRGGVENLKSEGYKGVFQTPQSSDEVDKTYDIWNDIFLDNVDIHDRIREENRYGPVLFKFRVELLESEELPPLWITKSNPIYWPDLEPNQRYYHNVQDFVREYNKGDFARMITLRDTVDVLPFSPYLEAVILDDPSHYVRENSTLENAYDALIRAANIGNIDPDIIKIRECEEDCDCYPEDFGDDKKLKKFFEWGTKY